MRIIAGKHKGRVLEAPEGTKVRPTSDRAREALFDILAHASFIAQPLLHGARVLDAFAGTGAMGLEALSRGAAHAVFMEKDRAVRDLLAANIKKLGEDKNSQVLGADALRPSRAPEPCTLIFLDPPYEDLEAGGAALLALAKQGWIAPEAIVTLEVSSKRDLPEIAGFTRLDERRYGAAKIGFLRYTGPATDAD